MGPVKGVFQLAASRRIPPLCAKFILRPYSSAGNSLETLVANVDDVDVFKNKKNYGTSIFCRRTHNCGELRLANVDESVELYGWLAFKRLGKFLVIRDSYGSIQATIIDEQVNALREIVENLHIESAVHVRGVVRDRGRNRTKKMETGDVEVEISELRVLNPAPLIMPVFADESSANESTEQTRLFHRYLDLRSKRMQHNLRLRSTITHAMRRILVERCGFVDVETPTLSQWTPGGAAEFVVPAAPPNAGRFYTLPQSPQLYKQLLMCGGIDRYFQVARCYRNEGAKTDRQPEFTQVDLEMSFVSQDDIIALVESLIVESWPAVLNDFKPNTPFPRITHAEAMAKFGSDKPDLRREMPSCNGEKANPFEFAWIVDFPLFTVNESCIFESTHHPFTAPADEHLEDLKAGTNLYNIRAQHYDLVLNGVELGGGSIRIHNSCLQRHVLENVLRLPTDTLKHFLEALKYGAPPHGGFALGLDRYVAILAEESYRLISAGAENPKQKKKQRKKSANSTKSLGETHEFVGSIRDVIAFPKTKAARCLTMGAPTHLPDYVYSGYGIAVKAAVDDETDGGKKS